MENRFQGSQFRIANSFYASKSGVTTTLGHGEQEEDIRKSRIEHLPSYRKFDLSGKLEFVVIFQTIEIERLSLQIQAMRVMLKDADRQIRNYLNYEVQIAELTENCHQLEQERINYQNQVQKMSLACNSLYQQLSDRKQQEAGIDDLKRQFANYRDELLRNNSTLKETVKQLEMDIQKKDQSEKENQNKAKIISKEIVRLNQIILENQNQLSSIKEQVAKKNNELNNCSMEIKKWENAAKQQKIGRQRVESQNNRLNQQIYNIEEQKKKIFNQMEKERTKVDNLKRQRDIGLVQIQNAKKYLKSSKECQQINKNELINQKKELENAKNQIVNHKQEITSLKTDLNNKKKQILDTQNQLKSQQKQFDNTKNELNGHQRQLGIAKKELDNTKQQLGKHKNQLNNHMQQLSKAKDRINHHKQQASIANNELQNTQRQMNEVINQLNQTKRQLESVINELTNKCRQLEGVKINLNNQIKELQNKHKQLQNNKRQHENTKRNLETSKQQYIKLKELNSTTENDLRRQKAMNEDLSKNNRGFIEEIKAQRRKYEQMAKFSIELKSLIDAKIGQLNKVKITLAEYSKQWQQKLITQRKLNEKIQSLESLIPVINNLKQEIFNLNVKISKKDEELLGKEQLITELTVENKELFHNGKQFEKYNLQLKSLLKQLEQKLLAERLKYENEKKKLINQLEKETKLKAQALNSNEKLQRQIEKIKQEGLIKEEMKNQIKRLNQNCKRQQNDFQALNPRFQNIQNIIVKLKTSQKTLNQLQKTNSLLKNQLNQSLNLNDQTIGKIGCLYQQVQTLNEEIFKLKDKLLAQMSKDKEKDDFVTCSNINQSATAKSIRSTGYGGYSSVTSTNNLKSSIKCSPDQSSLQQNIPLKPAFDSYFQKDKIMEKVTSSSNLGFSNSVISTTERPTFNAEITLSRIGKSRSKLEDFDKRILQPSNNYPYRQNNYSGLGSYTSRESSYGLQRRDKK